jgi:hypothetical protein
MQPQRARKGTWLQPIRVIIWILFALNVFSLPILLHQQGPVTVATTWLFEWPDPIRAQYPDLAVGDITIKRAGFEIPYGQFLLYRLAHGLAWVLAAIPILIVAERLAKRALYEDPFTKPVLRLLRRLSVLVLVAGVLAEVVEYAAARTLYEWVMPANFGRSVFSPRPDYQFDLWWLVLGLILLAVSAMVQRGVDIRQELDSVI